MNSEMHAPVTVEARFEADGSIRPLAFMLDQQLIRIASLGRQWEHNGERHFLVMSPDERVHELAYLPQQGVWRLCRRPQAPGETAIRV